MNGVNEDILSDDSLASLGDTAEKSSKKGISATLSAPSTKRQAAELHYIQEQYGGINAFNDFLPTESWVL